MIEITSTINNSISIQPNNLSKIKNNSICDGFGCTKNYISKIIVNAGGFGNLKLQLCDICINKFKGNEIEEVTNSNEM